MSPLQVLITGATGYIGGSFVAHVLGSKHTSLSPSVEYSVLLRSARQTPLFSDYNVKPIVLQNLEDVAELRDIASKFDIIINFAYIALSEHAKALVHGLGDRKSLNSNGREPVFIQASSGTSNVADRPFTAPNRVKELGLPGEFTDAKSSEVYDTEKKLEAGEPYALRTTELAVIDLGLASGIKTHVVMAPTVYGAGIGPGNKQSIQIPLLIRSVLKNGYLAVAGEGEQKWDRIHVRDLVALVAVLFARIVNDEAVATGKDGIVFANTSRISWRDLADKIVEIGIKLGKLPSDTKTKNLAFDEAAVAWGLEGAMSLAELGFSSNSLTKAEQARKWGWMPKYVDLDEGIKEDWNAIA